MHASEIARMALQLRSQVDSFKVIIVNFKQFLTIYVVFLRLYTFCLIIKELMILHNVGKTQNKLQVKDENGNTLWSMYRSCSWIETAPLFGIWRNGKCIYLFTSL